MNIYFGNIEEETLKNSNFRRVLHTGKYSQLVLMSLEPHQKIGLEVHDDVDQFFRFEKGTGTVVAGDDEFNVKDGDAILIPAGTKHNIINNSNTEDLKLYTIYSPPNHPDGTIHITKADALKDEDHH